MVVGFEIYHFSLFECTSRFAIIIAKGKWSIHGFKNVLKTGLNCDMVSNLVVEIAIYNFDLFHYTLMHRVINFLFLTRFNLALVLLVSALSFFGRAQFKKSHCILVVANYWLLVVRKDNLRETK